jgi:hypothetical protein
MLDRGMRAAPLFVQSGPGFIFPIELWPRALILRADLEAARGDKPKVKEFYQRFITLMSAADPEFQPIVDRAKKALAALGG